MSVDSALVLHILSQHASGVALSEACSEFGVRVSTLRAAIRQDPLLQQAAEDAKADFEETLQGALLNVTRDPLYGTTDPKLVGHISKNIQWTLERSNPKRFGEQKTDGGDLATILARALEAGMARIPQAPQPYTIEAVAVGRVMAPPVPSISSDGSPSETEDR